MCILCASPEDSAVRHWQSGMEGAGGSGSAGSGGPNFANPTGNVVATGVQNIDAVLFGVKWVPSNLTFNFPNPDFYSFENNYFQGLGINPIAAFQSTLNLANACRYILHNFYAGVSNLTFTETAFNTFPDMSIFLGTPIGPGTAVGGIPGLTGSLQATGDCWFDVNHPGDFANPIVGNYNWATAMHELGHALGLKHAHASDHGLTMQSLETDRDSMEFSIMTYRGYVGADPGTGYANAVGSYAQTLMMYDIAAIQHMYGANFNWNNGNSVYTFNAANGAASINGGFWLQSTANKVFLTIWDGGGTDTYDFANYITNQLIDLRPGFWSKLSDAQLADLGNGNFSRGSVFNALQFQDSLNSLIENANGGSGNDSMVGNQVGNALNGNAGNDTLDGGLGTDTLTGGAGNDQFLVNAAGDVVVEGASGGTDTVRTSVTYTLAAAAQVEVLRTTNDAGTGAINLTGNSGANIIIGNNGANVLLGGLGNDSLDGNGGIDTASYATATTAVTVSLALTTAQVTGGAGTDTLSEIENLIGGTGNDTLSGSAVGNAIDGGTGNDSLNGAAGNDTLTGGAGNDTFVVDAAGDVILETSTGGTDTLLLSASYTLAHTAYVETMATTNRAGTTALRLTGNIQANTILGNAGTNTLDGRGGNDTMDGGLGADTYYIDAVGDRVVEAANGGADRILTTVDITLSSTVHVETIQALDPAGTTALRLIGNAIGNAIIGNAGGNSLDGGGGNDTLTGGLGNDTYRIDSTGDRVIEAAGGGDDRVLTAADFVLGAGVEVETLMTTQTSGTAAINLTGNELDNKLLGNAGSNTLIGGLGNDRLDGSAGIDTVRYDGAAAITVNLSRTTAQNTGGAGTDTILNVENIVTGSGADSLTGSNAANLINAGAGNDTLLGGNGNDTLFGGLGKDQLGGGAGADRFDFDLIAEIGNGATRDLIRDFSHAQGDIIDLGGIDANTVLTNNQAFSFIEDDAFGDVAGQLRAISTSTTTFVEGDVNGDGTADFQIQFIGVFTLVIADFAL